MADVSACPPDPSSTAWRELEQVIARFEDAWHNGEQPALDDFLPGEPAVRQAALVELIHADLEFRLKAGEAMRVEAYLERYPELATNQGVVLGLIAAEFEVRRRQDATLTRDDYFRRFPQLREELAARLPTHGRRTWISPPGAVDAGGNRHSNRPSSVCI
jgi:eukaryotic-like serine/threonine-protein kinase